jgi:hypothetical protein
MTLESCNDVLTFGGWIDTNDGLYKKDKKTWVDSVLSQKSINLLIVNDTVNTDYRSCMAN